MKKLRKSGTLKIANQGMKHLSFQISSHIEKNVLMLKEDDRNVEDLIDNPLLIDIKHIIMEKNQNLFQNRTIFGFLNFQSYQK